MILRAAGPAATAVWPRLVLLAAAGASLFVALAAGLERACWDLPAVRPHHLLAHGPLLIGGFLGTLIGLEKAVALGRGWA